VATVLVTLVFFFYGFKLQLFIKSSLERSGDGNKEAQYKLLLITVGSTISQVGYAISVLVSFYVDYSAVATFLTTIFFEIIPTALLLYLFKFDGQFSSKRTSASKTASQSASQAEHF